MAPLAQCDLSSPALLVAQAMVRLVSGCFRPKKQGLLSVSGFWTPHRWYFHLVSWSPPTKRSVDFEALLMIMNHFARPSGCLADSSRREFSEDVTPKRKPPPRWFQPASALSEGKGSLKTPGSCLPQMVRWRALMALKWMNMFDVFLIFC